MSFAFGVPFTPRVFLLLVFRFLALVLIAFLVGTISCFVSKFSTIATASFESFLGPLFARGTCKEGIIILLFFPILSLLYCLEFVFQNLLNFCDCYCTFLSLSFMTSMAPSYTVCGREFNKCVINISSLIICPVFISSDCFFSMKAIQSMGLCLVFSSL